MPEIRRARDLVDQLTEERRRLTCGVVTGSIPDDLASEEQACIAKDLRQAERILEMSVIVYEHIEQDLVRTLGLLESFGEAYQLAGPLVRRRANQFMFAKIYVDGTGDGPHVSGADLLEPAATLLGGLPGSHDPERDEPRP